MKKVMNSSLDAFPRIANWIKSILKVVPKLKLTELNKAQP